MRAAGSDLVLSYPWCTIRYHRLAFGSFHLIEPKIRPIPAERHSRSKYLSVCVSPLLATPLPCTESSSSSSTLLLIYTVNIFVPSHKFLLFTMRCDTEKLGGWKRNWRDWIIGRNDETSPEHKRRNQERDMGGRRRSCMCERVHSPYCQFHHNSQWLSTQYKLEGKKAFPTLLLPFFFILFYRQLEELVLWFYFIRRINTAHVHQCNYIWHISSPTEE